MRTGNFTTTATVRNVKVRSFRETIQRKLVFSNMALCLITNSECQTDYKFDGKFESITMK